MLRPKRRLPGCSCAVTAHNPVKVIDGGGGTAFCTRQAGLLWGRDGQWRHKKPSKWRISRGGSGPWQKPAFVIYH